jgi:hypothetical protein
MKDFLEKLPPLLASLSKAFLIALIEQMREVARVIRTFLSFLGRLFLRSAKYLWAIYYRIETQILGVLVDLVLAIVALRYLFLLLGIGAVLVYFKLWILVAIYVLLLSIATFRFFRIDRKAVAQEMEYHKQSHDTYVRLLRWPLRALASVVLLYASWQFFGWHPLYALWVYKPPAKVSKVEETRKAEETQRIERDRKAEDTRKAEEEDRQHKNSSGDISSQPPPQIEGNSLDIAIKPGWYRLTNRYLGEGRSLEASSSGDSTLSMGITGHNQRQMWEIAPDHNGWYRLINHSFNPPRSLDTYSDGENQPFVGQIGNYSGQLWRITYLGDGWYRLNNQYLGQERAFDTYGNGDNRPFMGKTGNYTGQYWKLTRLQDIEKSNHKLDGIWVGRWSYINGDECTCEMRLSVSYDNIITGSITWVLEKTLRPDLQSKIGLKAVEYVRGTYNSNTSVANFEGYSKEDPYGIISLDKYRLSLASDNNSLNGKTYAAENWEGRFSAYRKK